MRMTIPVAIALLLVSFPCACDTTTDQTTSTATATQTTTTATQVPVINQPTSATSTTSSTVSPATATPTITAGTPATGPGSGYLKQLLQEYGLSQAYLPIVKDLDKNLRGAINSGIDAVVNYYRGVFYMQGNLPMAAVVGIVGALIKMKVDEAARTAIPSWNVQLVAFLKPDVSVYNMLDALSYDLGDAAYEVVTAIPVVKMLGDAIDEALQQAPSGSKAYTVLDQANTDYQTFLNYLENYVVDVMKLMIAASGLKVPF